MRGLLVALFLLTVFVPTTVFGVEKCRNEGSTIVYVNGVLTDRQKAGGDLKVFEKEFENKSVIKDVVFTNAYNPTHLEGAADAIQVVSQAILRPISNYDRDTMLRQIHPEVTTRKILLVGHSQGTFYTNEMYGYLVQNGVPEESIAVYNLATPASYVAGDDTNASYLTSGNDGLVTKVREWAAMDPVFSTAQPLPSNILIPLSDPNVPELWRGHAFSGEYLAGAPLRVVSDIDSVLNDLEAGETINEDGCFTPPSETLTYKAQQAFFTVGDPVATVLANNSQTALAILHTTTGNLGGALASATSAFNDLFANEDSPADQAATASLALVDDVESESSEGEEDVVQESVEIQTSGTRNEEDQDEEPEREEEVEGEGVEVIEDDERSDAEELGDEDVTASGGEEAPEGFRGGEETQNPWPGGYGFGGGGNEADQEIQKPEGETNSSESTEATEPGVEEEQTPEPPDAPVLSSRTCDQSISHSTCIVATTTLEFSWIAPDASHFSIESDTTTFATTTATTTMVTVPGDGAHTFSVSVTDENDLTSATSSLHVEVVTMPVVISEVAWMGTQAGHTHQWIELHNNTNADIDLSGWHLYSSDGSPDIVIGNDDDSSVTARAIIPADGYYILEWRSSIRMDEPVISDMAAGWYGTFGAGGLVNGGEDLFLGFVRYGATTTVDQVNASGGWPAGNNNSSWQRKTMERIDPRMPGSDPENWASALGDYIQNGLDAENNRILGTPGARNSTSHRIFLKGAETILSSSNGPYIIPPGGLRIPSDKTLIIEEGVVIKSVGARSRDGIRVEGTLRALGTPSHPIVFTSFEDDEYGGDLNNDGLCDPGNASSTAACPEPGDWRHIVFTETSTDSLLQHTIARYAGRWTRGMKWFNGNVVVDGSDVEFDHFTSEYSRGKGLLLVGSESTVANSTFRHNTHQSEGRGIYIRNGGAPVITDSFFESNRIGLAVESSSVALIKNNVFTNNESIAATGGTDAVFIGNSGSGNGKNGIDASGTLYEDKTYTLHENELPYVLGVLHVTSSSTLAFESGVILKGGERSRLVVRDGGTVSHIGSNTEDVLFTSENDDTAGGAMFVGTSTPEAGDWFGVEVRPGGIFDMSGFTLRFAGKRKIPTSITTGLDIVGATTTVSNAVIEHNKQNGIHVREGGILILSDATVRNHTEARAGSAVGIRVGDDSHADLADVTFADNTIDILD